MSAQMGHVTQVTKHVTHVTKPRRPGVSGASDPGRRNRIGHLNSTVYHPPRFDLMSELELFTKCLYLYHYRCDRGLGMTEIYITVGINYSTNFLKTF